MQERFVAERAPAPLATSDLVVPDEETLLGTPQLSRSGEESMRRLTSSYVRLPDSELLGLPLWVRLELADHVRILAMR